MRPAYYTRPPCTHSRRLSHVGAAAAALPAGIHLHEVALCRAPLPEQASARAAWANILKAYASSRMIRSVELPAGFAWACPDWADDLMADPDWAEDYLGPATWPVIAAAMDGALVTHGWDDEGASVAVTAAVGRADERLNPDDSVQQAAATAAEVSLSRCLPSHQLQACAIPAADLSRAMQMRADYRQVAKGFGPGRCWPALLVRVRVGMTCSRG
jgi:hypothetical protein